MEIIPKVGILVGIAAVIIMMPFMVMTQYSFLSHEFGSLFVDQEAILKEFKTFDSYVLFKEKFPDSYDDERTDRSGHVRLEVQAYNFDTGNRMELSIRYDNYDNDIRQRVHCDINNNSLRESLGWSASYQLAAEPSPVLPSIFMKQGSAEDEFVYDFIKYTNCLEIGDETETKKTSYPEKDAAISHYIAIPEGTGMLGCEINSECFLPSHNIIDVGDVVRWSNFDQSAHTIMSGTPEDGPFDLFDSGLLHPTETFEVSFDEVGEYPYFCLIHPWQTGTISVMESEEQNNEIVGEFTSSHIPEPEPPR